METETRDTLNVLARMTAGTLPPELGSLGPESTADDVARFIAKYDGAEPLNYAVWEYLDEHDHLTSREYARNLALVSKYTRAYNTYLKHVNEAINIETDGYGFVAADHPYAIASARAQRAYVRALNLYNDVRKQRYSRYGVRTFPELVSYDY